MDTETRSILDAIQYQINERWKIVELYRDEVDELSHKIEAIELYIKERSKND